MDKWSERYKTGEGLRWWPNEELVRFLGKTYGDMRQVPCRGKKAIELGCGTGCNLIALTAFGFYPYGYDASMEAVNVADEYVGSWGLPLDRQWHVGQLQLPNDLPWQAGSIDLVVDAQTIQHLSEDDHVKVYAEVARVLKLGGRFFSMHWYDGKPDIIYANSYPELVKWPGGKLYLAIEKAGLTIVSNENVARTYKGEWMADWHIIHAVKS